jgi:methyl-accepting chemotaxis protein
MEARAADADRQRVVKVLRERLSAMAAGNLNEPIRDFLPEPYKGIRMDFNQAQEALRNLIDAVCTSAEQIRFSAGDVNDAATDLSERSARQAATLEETVAALQRANSGIQSSAQLAQDTNTEVALARQNATTNRQIVEDAVDAMHQIQVAFAEVTKITDIIQNIAFQTNILALNAGVEAVRAGEAGKGFGVVATEVRALAQRSSEAVSSIQQLMSQSGARIEHGVDQVAASGSALREMIAIIDRVSERIGDLAAASLAQADELNEIDAAISSLERDTHQNAAMAEQSSAASGLLSQEVMRLAEKTALFRDDGGAQTVANPAVRLRRAA